MSGFGYFTHPWRCLTSSYSFLRNLEKPPLKFLFSGKADSTAPPNFPAPFDYVHWYTFCSLQETMKVTDDRRGAIALKVLFLGTPCP